MAKISLKSFIPWRILNFIQISKNKICFFKLSRNLESRIVKHQKNIVFDMGFHGISGGPVAIASIANMLADFFNVYFISFPESHYNQLLSEKILVINRQDNLYVDLFVSDENKKPADLKNMQEKAPLLMTIHCLNGILTGLTKQQLSEAMDNADFIHFVSQVQQDSFKTNKIFNVIPNSCIQVKKNSSQPAIGSVGRLTSADKGALATVEIGRAAGISHIHLWGGKGLPYQGTDLYLHPWESDKTKIYNSFDVLVFMSKFETFGLVVIEAMSAGIPCLLSDIDAFQQFKSCPGILLVDPSNIQDAAAKLRILMENRDQLKDELIRYWQAHYSEEVIKTSWHRYIQSILNRKLLV